MAWIKIDHTLPNKPEVFFIAQELFISKTEVVGHLVSLWIWVDQNSEDGKVQASKEMIDELTTKNFASALVEQGWLKFEQDGKLAQVSNFEKHNSNSAKKRALGADRVAKYRKRNSTSVTRVDKNREDKNRKEKTWTK
jgi:DNA replication protein DnaT